MAGRRIHKCINTEAAKEIMLLVLADSESDRHAAEVAQELASRGVEHAFIKHSDYPLLAKSTISIDSGVQAYLETDRGRVDIREVSAIWYRRPGFFDLPEELDRSEAHWLRKECGHAISSVYRMIDAFWLSDPLCIARCSLKPYQLAVAHGLGMKTPRTLFTNDPRDALAFIDSCADGVVVKALAEPAVLYEDRLEALELYTLLLSPEDRNVIEAVANGPTQFQEFIDKRCEVRVTVMGKDVHAASIRSTDNQKRARVIDYRRQETFELPHETIELPKEIEQFCCELVQHMGLVFGAIDFVIDTSGDYYFLEISPNGQWLWIEWMTRSISRFILQPC